MAVGLHQPRPAIAALHERLQHAERQIGADIVVARRHERPADAARAGAEVEHLRPRNRRDLEHRGAHRFRDPRRELAVAVEARRQRVVGGLRHCDAHPGTGRTLGVNHHTINDASPESAAACSPRR
jgi:hypothetical protein